MILQASQIDFGYRHKTVLDDVNLTVKSGERVGLFAPSGRGKTTLLNILAALDRPTSGQVLLNGRSLSGIRESELAAFRRCNLGFVFQEFNLLDTFSLRDNIVLPLVLAGRNHREMDRSLEPVARKLGIDDILSKYPYEVSGGQKQRAAVARALITKPQLLLADEPTGALDSRSARMLLERLEELNQIRQTTILMVTHDAFTASCCHRVIFLRDGQIFLELSRGGMDRRAFFAQIIRVVSQLGGEMEDVL